MLEHGKPKIGDGATVRVGSDSYGGTVISVDGDGVVTVQNDKVTPGEGHDYYSKQVWVHEPNPSGQTYSFRWDIKGLFWRSVVKDPKTNRWLTTPHTYLVFFGERHTYQDPSF